MPAPALAPPQTTPRPDPTPVDTAPETGPAPPAAAPERAERAPGTDKRREPRDPPAAKAPEPKRSAAELYAEGADLFVRGKHAEAKDRFKQAIDVDPGHAPAYRGLGLVYQAQGKKDKAKAAFEKYLRLAPNAADAAAIRQRIAKLDE
jgi:tetratricopeptide (TPR) repeat protein